MNPFEPEQKISPTEELIEATRQPIPIAAHTATAIVWADKAKEIKIVSAEDFALASENLARCRQDRKAIQAAEQRYTAPFNTYIKIIRSAFHDVLEKFAAAEDIMDAKIMRFRENERLRIAEENLRLEREAHERAEEKKKAATEMGFDVDGAKPEPTAIPHVPDPPRAIETRAGTVEFAEYWTWEVEDFGKFLRWVLEDLEARNFYIEVAHGPVTADVKQRGVREIPGIRIYQTAGTRVKK